MGFNIPRQLDSNKANSTPAFLQRPKMPSMTGVDQNQNTLAKPLPNGRKSEGQYQQGFPKSARPDTPLLHARFTENQSVKAENSAWYAGLIGKKNIPQKT